MPSPDVEQMLYQLTSGVPGGALVPTGNMPVPTGNLPANLTANPMPAAGGWSDLFGGMGQGPPALQAGPTDQMVHVPGQGYGTGAGTINSDLASQVSNSGMAGAASAAEAAAPSFAGTAAEAAAPGLLSQLGALSIPGGRLGAGAAGFGLGIGGHLAANAVGNQSSLGKFLSGAGTGAGFGLAAGNLIGPLGEIPGALLGGLAGGVMSMLSSSKGSPGAKIESALSSLPIPDDQKSQYRLMFKILSATGDEKTAAATVGQQMIADMQQKQQQSSVQAQMLATQALTSQFFQPFTQQLLSSANTRAGITDQLADQLPAPYRAVAREMSASSLDNTTKTANAYAAQAQLIPALASLQAGQSASKQLANTQLMQQLRTAAGGSTSAGGSLAALIQQSQQTGG